MTGFETVQLIFAVMAADVMCEGVKWAVSYWRSRGKPECELCHRIRVTRRTKDKKYWSCRSCRIAYYKENGI